MRRRGYKLNVLTISQKETQNMNHDIINALAAKSGHTDKSDWLPLVIHANDTAGIIQKLFSSWLPDHVRNGLAMDISLNGGTKPSQGCVRRLCELIALLHDIGKITPSFQNIIAKNIDNHEDYMHGLGLDISGKFKYSSKSPHKIAGYVILREISKIPNEISVIIGFHHGRTDLSAHDEQLVLYSKNYFGENKADKKAQEKLWRGLWNDWISYALEKTGFTIETLPKPDVKAQMILTGLLIMADWIASNTYYFPYINIGEDVNAIDCNERVNRAWELFGLPKVLEIENCCDSPEIFSEKFGFNANPMQRQVMEIIAQNPCPGLYVLEAPMGLGKTEAALSAAEILIDRTGCGGVYFGLPTQATANGIFRRIAGWASKCDPGLHSIRLAHGMTELNEEYKAMFHGNASGISFDSKDDDENVKDNIIVHEWFEGRKQALLSDFVIATTDQFLLASLKQKHVMLRHLGLSGKVVILDECHAYDSYMNVYLDHTLTWMGAYGVPVIVLSATLPPERRDELIRAYMNNPGKIECDDGAGSAYPVLTSVIKNKITRRALSSDMQDKKISAENLEEENLAHYLRDKLSGGGCAAVIVNTVAYAQEIAKILKRELKDFKIVCFHSRFIATDRAKIEAALLKNAGKDSTPHERDKLIVVGTQVIEQSLDLDFDTMITELCPMDLLLQRSGRLHRHKKRKRPLDCEKPVLAVLRPSKPRRSVYDEWILQQTQKYLPDVIVVPSDIPKLVGKVYAKPEVSEQNEAYLEYCKKIEGKQYKAEKYCIHSNMLDMHGKSLITKFLDDDAGNSTDAEASVRDTDETIEVLALQKKSASSYGLISKNISFDTTSELNENEEILVARERLKLPRFFSEKYNIEKTIKQLDILPKRWKSSKLLKNELMLVLDDNMEAGLDGKKLRYSVDFGLEMLEELPENSQNSDARNTEH